MFRVFLLFAIAIPQAPLLVLQRLMPARRYELFLASVLMSLPMSLTDE